MNYAYSVTDRFAGLVTIVSEHRQALETQFARILSEYGAAISRLAFSYEAVASVREELVQEIALAIWQALAHFRGDCSERTFVYRIAHNRGLTHVAGDGRLISRWRNSKNPNSRLIHGPILRSRWREPISGCGLCRQFSLCQ